MGRYLVFLITISMMSSLGLSAYGQDNSTGKAIDLLKGAIDPLATGGERSLFLKAAGVDVELDESEFVASKQATGGFVRSFERYSTLLLFDKNKDTQIDWFEADSYRRAVRAAVLATYDTDKNSRLTGQEREKANKALAAGKLPRLGDKDTRSTKGDRHDPGSSKPSSKGKPGLRRDESPGEARRVEWEALQSKLGKKYDRDGNGRINTKEEWQAAGPEIKSYYEKREIEKFDRDNDGKVSDEERREGKERETRLDLKYRHDVNRDGKLTGAEQKAFDKSVQEHYDKQEMGNVLRNSFMTRFDADDDGELNEQEKKSAGAYYKELGEAAKESSIKHFDSDGDGQLNEQEREAGRKAIEKEGLKKYDTDGDGELRIRERTEAVRSDQKDAEWLYHMHRSMAEDIQRRRNRGDNK